jgi:uncharacterized membrane protein
MLISVPERRPETQPAESARARVESIDAVRGLIIVVMALDHVRDFFGDLASSPTNLATTTPALFFTRWITHICAPVFFLLRAFENGVPRLLRPALILGKVPLFFFVVHFFLIHLLAVAACYLRYGTVSEMFQSPDIAHFPFTAPPGWSAGLPVVYLLWATVVLSLLPFCRWYAGVKRRRTYFWLSYV